MTRSGYLERRVRGRSSILNKRIWLIAGLLLVFITACRPAVGELNLPSPEKSRQATSLPANTATVTPGTNQSQTKVAPFTETYTLQPSISAETDTVTPQPSATIVSRVTFAAIGDYGSGNQDEGDVARLIDSWQPDFIITWGIIILHPVQLTMWMRRLGNFFTLLFIRIKAVMVKGLI
jgi:hypothetical protein